MTGMSAGWHDKDDDELTAADLGAMLDEGEQVDVVGPDRRPKADVGVRLIGSQNVRVADSHLVSLQGVPLG